MSASQNNLTLTLNQQDSNGTNILNRILGAYALAGTVGEYIKGTLTTTGATAQSLPTANVLNYLLVNTHATAVITVIGTPQGGASATLAKVQPGSVFANWCGATGTGATAGFTALSLTSDTVGATFEEFMGG